jgi:hypothetical protein
LTRSHRQEVGRFHSVEGDHEQRPANAEETYGTRTTEVDLMNAPRRWVGVSLLVLALQITLLCVAAADASPQGLAAANQVNQLSYQGFMNNSLYTHTGNSRGPSGAHLIPCRNNIQSRMQSYGLSVALESFTYSGNTYHNVVGTMTGSVYPNRIYIIGSHYDSVSNPGADDNASGTAAVLEAARIISQYDSDCTIKFIAFSMEEVGLVGSDAYVAAHAGADIRGMVSADMVAYDPSTNHALIYGKTASNLIKNALAAAIAEYGAGITYTVGGDEPYSDHAPFEDAGYQACLLIEGEVWNNPYYHTQSDNYEQAGNLNFPYAVKMTRSLVGWLVDAAGVDVPYDGLKFTYPNGLPEYSYPPGGPAVRVTVSGMGSVVPQPGTGILHYNLGAGWLTTAMTQVSSNVYDAVLPAASCGGTVQYYVSAQSTGSNTFNDPAGAPAAYYTTTVGYGVTAFYQNSLTTSPGWTTTGQWAFGHPTGGGSYNHDPSNGYTGTNVYGYNLSGDYANNIGVYYLTTTAINCTGRYNVKLDFYRWLGVESNSNYDKATIQASNNGSTWTTIWQAVDTGGAVSDASWQHVIYNISAVANNKPSVQIRWGMGPTDSYVTYPGWNIDDVKLTSLLCTPDCGGSPTGDMNGAGGTNGEDLQPFVDALMAHSTDPAKVCPGDFSGNLVVDLADVPGMVDALLGL